VNIVAAILLVLLGAIVCGGFLGSYFRRTDPKKKRTRFASDGESDEIGRGSDAQSGAQSHHSGSDSHDGGGHH
jgi:hypothetical protein